MIKRGLHRKYGYGSIHEFGAKIGGLSHNTFNTQLMKPSVMKDVGLSKLTRVANVATKETEGEWAKNVQLLSKAALEVKIKESLPGQECKEQLSLTGAENDASWFSSFDYMSSRDVFRVELDIETIQELRGLKANMKKGTTWDDVFKVLMSGQKNEKQRRRGTAFFT